jgi:hypothetical protein
MLQAAMKTAGAAIALMLVGVGCSAAGPYGYARTYVPTDGEEAAVGEAREYDPVMSTRRPEDWKAEPVQLFAVVSSRERGPDGATLMNVSMRRVEARNLCGDESSQSCRVTVTAKAFATLRVLVKLAPEDDTGAHRVEPGSLLRLVGKLESVGGDDKPLLRASWYRHWPGDQYVTTAARAHMRQ